MCVVVADVVCGWFVVGVCWCMSACCLLCGGVCCLWLCCVGGCCVCVGVLYLSLV